MKVTYDIKYEDIGEPGEVSTCSIVFDTKIGLETVAYSGASEGINASIADDIAIMSQILQGLIQNSNYIPQEVGTRLFRLAFFVISGNGVDDSTFDAVAGIDDELIAELLLKWLPTDDLDMNRIRSPEGLAKGNALAETLGPDWCQVLYHLAVLSTRLC